MADWSSSQYLKFKNQRTQPAVDLAMRVVEKRPETFVDLKAIQAKVREICTHTDC